MTETHNAIAGVPPYERGFHAMGYLEEVPPLRIITDELMIVSTLEELPQVLTREETYIYIPASLLLENSTQQDFIRELSFNDKLRILVDSPANSFEMIAFLRQLRAIAKIPISCWVYSITDYLYALIAQTDDLITKNKELALPENQLLIANSLVTKTIDPFYL